ncbi:MAG: hypothetical protein M3Z24_03060, partial [Chloroflexota bacterium]|nr:hypothetical protein [Chloroflexota bacterium]
RQALSEITGKNAFQGVSGAISFGPDGGTINKATGIVCADKNNHFRLVAVLGQFLVNSPPLTGFPAASACS